MYVYICVGNQAPPWEETIVLSWLQDEVWAGGLNTKLVHSTTACASHMAGHLWVRRRILYLYVFEFLSLIIVTRHCKA